MDGHDDAVTEVRSLPGPVPHPGGADPSPGVHTTRNAALAAGGADHIPRPAAHPVGLRSCLVVGAVVALLSLIPMANIWNPSFPFDDAYISFAYALHLATGHGLVLNAGTQPVEGFSNPSWVLVLAFGRLFSIPVPTWSFIVNAALTGCLAGTTMGLVRTLAPRSPSWTGAAAGIFVAFVPATAFAADGGLETLLFAALFTAFLLAFLRDAKARRPLSWPAITLGVLLTLTRPEGAVVLASAWITSWAWHRDVRRQLRAASGFLAPGMLIELARIAIFHQLLPNSVVAKEGTTLAQLLSGAGLEATHFWSQYALVIVVALATMVTALIWRRDLPDVWPIVPVTLALGVFEVAVSVGDNYPFERYLYSVLPALAACAVAGIALAGWPTAQPPGRHRRRRTGTPRKITASVAALALCAGSVSLAYANRELPWVTGGYLNVARGAGKVGDILRSDHLDQHGGIYNYALAAWLRAHQRGRPLVALDEIGIVSYYTPVRVVDLIGLADRHIARFPGTMGSRADPGYVFGMRPDDIVFLSSGCICASLHDDSVYASDHWMLGYRLTDVLYDGPTVSALLFQRTPDLISVEPLGSQLPAHVATRGPLPEATLQLLDEATQHAPASADMVAGPTLQAGGTLAVRPEVTVITPGATATMSIGSAPGHCSVTATAVTAGGSTPSTLVATVVGGNGAVLATRTVSLGPGPSLASVTLALDGVWEGAHLQLTGTAGASWVEPYEACTSIQGGSSQG